MPAFSIDQLEILPNRFFLIQWTLARKQTQQAAWNFSWSHLREDILGLLLVFSKAQPTALEEGLWMELSDLCF